MTPTIIFALNGIGQDIKLLKDNMLHIIGNIDSTIPYLLQHAGYQQVMIVNNSAIQCLVANYRNQAAIT